MQFFHYPYRQLVESHLTQRGERVRDYGHFYRKMAWTMLVGSIENQLQGNIEKAAAWEWHAQGGLGLAWWHRNGKPYAKVYPKMADILSHVRLNVPMSILKLPFPALEIKLCAEPGKEFRQSPDHPPIHSIFFHQSFDISLNTNEQLQAARQTIIGDDDSIPDFEIKPDNQVRRFELTMGVPTPPGSPYPFDDVFLTLYYDESITLDEVVTRACEHKVAGGKVPLTHMKDHKGPFTPSPEFLKRTMSLVLATCLLINGEDDDVLPDLPRRLVDRYERSKTLADGDRERENAEIMRQAAKSGHTGVEVGRIRETELPRPQYQRDPDAEGEGRGHQLSYGQIRSAHPRLQPYGSRANPLYKVKLIPMARVRPDLPLNPNAKTRAYKIGSEKMEEDADGSPT